MDGFWNNARKKKRVSYFPSNELGDTERTLVSVVLGITDGKLHVEPVSPAMHARTLVIVSNRKAAADRAVKDLIAKHGLGLVDLNARVLMDAARRDADVGGVDVIAIHCAYVLVDGLTNNRYDDVTFGISCKHYFPFG